MFDLDETLKIGELRSAPTNTAKWREMMNYYKARRTQIDLERAEICAWATRYCVALDRGNEDERTVKDWLGLYLANRLDMVNATPQAIRETLQHVNGSIAEGLEQVVAEGADRVKRELKICIDELERPRIQIL